MLTVHQIIADKDSIFDVEKKHSSQSQNYKGGSQPVRFPPEFYEYFVVNRVDIKGDKHES